MTVTQQQHPHPKRIILPTLPLHSTSQLPGADVVLQREVAERLANEAVKAERQQQIVELGGLKLLLPLTKSEDNEVQRLAAHALANLSVSTDNQVQLAQQGGVEMLISLLPNKNVHVQRQAAKALANLGVNVENKVTVAVKRTLFICNLDFG